MLFDQVIFKQFLKIITLLMIVFGISLIFIDTRPILDNLVSTIFGFTIAVFSIPYYVLSVLIFFPKKVANAKNLHQSKKAEIIKTKFGKVSMDNLPLITYYKCPNCNTENMPIAIFWDENNLEAVKCEKCGATVNEKYEVYKCGKCGNYYPMGQYRCPKCKYK